MIINPYLVQPSGPAYGTLTTAWIAATGETDSTILGALNTLEADMATYGLTAKMKALYPMVGGTSTKHSYNFINTSQFQLTFNGGWTHSSTGALPNGTNAYADTGLNNSVVLNDTTYGSYPEPGANSTHLAYYSRTNITASQVEMGVISGQQAYLIFNYTSQRYSALNHSGASVPTLPNTTGLLIESRVSYSEMKSYKNGSLANTLNTITYGKPTANTYLGANNYGGANAYSSKQCAFASIGDGLTSTDASNLYTAVQAFQTTLSRQV